MDATDANNNRVAPKSVVLGLTLTADPDDGRHQGILPAGPGQRHGESHLYTGDNFDDADTDYVTVFNIRPAQCELLYSGRDCSGCVGYGNLRHQPGVWGRNGGRRADVHLLWDREPSCGGDV